MNIVEMIARSHNGHGLDVLGQQFGLTQEQTLRAVAELAPMVTSGIRHNTREPDSMVSLLEALSGGQHARYLDEDSAVQYELFFWSSNMFFIENTKSDIRFEIRKAFREQNIEIPYPQRVIHQK